ncbi:undecaprenyl-phosphate galactose phosphotransferase WbaP [Candidatus Parcubacteria bacterium]|nr:MAG: undecaprenyl-phosphate galactose phosphotransferase WbaP [Candidatus Parcubacteria bacterium]
MNPSRLKTWLVSITFLLCDFLLLLGIFYLALVVRRVLLGPGVTWQAITPLARLGILFCIGTFFAQGMYPGYGLTAVKELERMDKAITLAFFLLAAVAYLNKPFQTFSRAIVLSAWAMSMVVLPVAHFLVRNLLSRMAWYGEPVIVFGAQPWAGQVARSLKRVRRLGWVPVAILPLERVDQETRNAEVRMAIVALSGEEVAEEWFHVLNRRFRRVLLLRQSDRFGSLWVEARDLDGRLGLEYTYHLLSLRNRWLKRVIDWLGGGILLILLSPLLGLLALLIVLDSPGPILFQQERLGKQFRRFRVLKFRTMVVDAEARLQEILDRDPAARAQYERHHKLENDPRITRVGRWLRKFSLDELPQLVNVLRGEMSLVGPRAYMPSELKDMGSYADIVLRVAPGMTGWWQVQGRHRTTFQQRLQMDEYYISNWSLWMDIFILLKTFWVVLRGGGG